MSSTANCPPSGPAFARVLEWDRACAVLLNRSLSPALEKVWVAVDRLGDYRLWVVFILALAAFCGPTGTQCAIHMIVAGGLALACYKIVKSCAGRPRPCAGMVRRCVEPLDEFSFPSGHTLHAVALSVVALAHLPILGFVLVPFTALVALSRVALGLHYPSDVLAGAAIGASTALLSFAIVF